MRYDSNRETLSHRSTRRAALRRLARNPRGAGEHGESSTEAGDAFRSVVRRCFGHRFWLGRTWRVTEASDVDWTLLIDGPADPNHATVVSRIRERLEGLGLGKAWANGDVRSDGVQPRVDSLHRWHARHESESHTKTPAAFRVGFRDAASCVRESSGMC